MTYSHVLTFFVNWRLFRDTSLKYCMKRLLSQASHGKVPELLIACSTEVLVVMDLIVWIEQNWGYTSGRYMRMRPYIDGHASRYLTEV